MNSLKQKRIEIQFTLEQLSDKTGIDKSVLSKYELGKRIPTANHIRMLAFELKVSFNELSCFFQAEKIANMLRYEPQAKEILSAAESRIAYLTSVSPNLNVPVVSGEIEERLFEVDALKEKWAKVKPLDGTQLTKLQEYFNTKYTFDSNQIEGNTLTYRETSLVINEGVTVSGKSMRDHLEAINHADAIYFMYDLVNGKEDISKRTILELHQLILKSIDQENAGKYRAVPVRISGSTHIPPEPFMIEKLMEGYLDYYRQNQSRVHAVILAAEMHERLVSIHPFIDGNGRTSRLIMNIILLKNGFTVTSLKGDNESRLKYYESLEKVQLNNDPTQFYHLILDRLTESLEEHLSMV